MYLFIFQLYMYARAYMFVYGRYAPGFQDFRSLIFKEY